MKKPSLQSQIYNLEATSRQRIVSVETALRELSNRLPAYPKCEQMQPEDVQSRRIDALKLELDRLERSVAGMNSTLYNTMKALGVEHRSDVNPLYRPGFLERLGRAISRLNPFHE